MVIGSYPSYGQMQHITTDLFMDAVDVKTKSHPFVVDGLVGLQQLTHRFVYGLRYPSFDHVGYPYRRGGYLFSGKYPLEGLMQGLDKIAVRNGDLVVLAEHGDDAVILKMVHRHLLGVGFNKWQTLNRG